MFTRFNRTNIVGAYKQQLGDLAEGVAKRTSQAVRDNESKEFLDYLRALEDLGKMQNIDIWIVSNEDSKKPLDASYTNVELTGMTIPAETQSILRNAFAGKKKKYSD